MSDNEDLVTIDLPASDSSDDLVTIEYEAPEVQIDDASKEVKNFRDVPLNINRGPNVDPLAGQSSAPIVSSQEEADKSNLSRYVLDGTEVRQAEANLIGGKAGGNPRTLSPDGMTIYNRQALIEQEKMAANKLAFGKPRQEAFDRIRDLERKQTSHRANYANWMESIITDKPVDFVGEDSQIHKTGTRTQKAISLVANKEAEIDKIINNKAFRNWAAGKDIIVDDNSHADKKVRQAAEEFLSSTPTNVEYSGDLLKRAYDSAVSIGPGASGSLGIALKSMGAEGVGQWFEDLAAGADLAATNWEDPRKVSGAKEFGQNLASGFGSVATTIIPGAAVLKGAKIAGAGASATRLLIGGYTLGSSGALSAWDQYKDARASGATDEEAAYAAGLAAITQAPLELVSPVPKWLNKLSGGLKQQAMKKLYEAVLEGAQEGAVETAQQLSSNEIARRLYDKDRDFWEGVESSAGVGGITGMVTSLLVNAITKGKAHNPNTTPAQKKEIESEDAINQKADELSTDEQSQTIAKSFRQDAIKAQMEENQRQIDEDVEGTRPNTQFLKEDNARLQKEYDDITAEIGSFEGAKPEANPEQDKAQVKSISEELKELDKQFEATEEEDVNTLEELNARRFELLDEQARIEARKEIDPQSQEPVTTRGERSRAQTMANIQSQGVPVNRPTQAQVIATQKKVNQTIGKMFVGGTQQKRAAKVKASIKKAINDNIQFIAGTNTEIISADDYNETAKKGSKVDPQTYTSLIGSDGRLFLVLPSIGELVKSETKTETRAASKEATADQIARLAPKKIEEEIIHLAMLSALKESNPDRSGAKGTDIRYIQERISRVTEEIRRTNPKAVPALAGIYPIQKKEGETKKAFQKREDYSIGTEMVRVVLQRLRTGQLTEDVEAIQRAEQEVFSDSDRNAILSLKNAIVEALIAIRDTILRYLNPKTSTPEMKRILKETETVLDRFGVVEGKENNVTYKDYSESAPQRKESAQPKETEEAATQDQTLEQETSETSETEISDVEEDFIVDDKRELTRQGEVLLDKIDAGGAIPAFISRNLESIANENGIEVTARMTPEDVISELRKLRGEEARPLQSAARKRGEIASERISNQAIDDIEAAAESLAPKKDRSGQTKVSQVTREGKTFPASLVSPYADSIDNTYVTSNASNDLRNAVTKLRDMPGGFDIFRAANSVAHGMTYGLSTPEEQAFLAFANNNLYSYKNQYLNSSASEKDKASLAENYIDTAGAIENRLTAITSTGGSLLQSAKMLRSFGSPGSAAKMARDAVRGSSEFLKRVLGVEFHEAASQVRGARNKSLDTIMSDGTLIARIKNLLKEARKNPERLAADIRKNFSKKKTMEAREIVLQFCAKIFSKGSAEVSEAIVRQTSSILMSTALSKTITQQDSETLINRAISQVAVDIAKGEKAPARKITGSAAKLQAVMGNEKTRLQFVDALEKEISKKYGKNQKEFRQEFRSTFERMRDSAWSESLRNQSIKDVAQMLNFKHEDLFGYLGEKRNANTAEVKAHFQKILGDIAPQEQIDEFINEVDTYLTERTADILKNKLSLTIDDKMKPLMNQKIRELSTEEYRSTIKSIKDIARLSFSQTRRFKEAFIERVIDEIGLPDKQSRELAQLLETNLTTAILAQKNAMLEAAIKKATEVVEDEGYESTGKSVADALIENAFSGVFSSYDVYEAFRKTHKFPDTFMPFNHDLENELLAWGEKAMSLPEGDARNREQQKMMQYYQQQAPISLVKDTAQSWWYMSLLTGIGTYGIVNPLASIINITGNIAAWTIANPGNPSAGLNMIKGVFDMMLDKDSVARNNFAYVMETGLNPSGVELKYPKVDVIENAGKMRSQVDPITKLMQRVVRGINLGRNIGVFGSELSPRAMLRSLRAADAYFRAISEEVVARRLGYTNDSALFEKAKQQAESEYAGSSAEESVKRREIMMRASEIYNDWRIQNPADKRIIDQDARESTFTQKPQGLAGHIAGVIEGLAGRTEVLGFPTSTLIVPFTRIVANAFNSNINYVPIIGAARGALGIKGVRKFLGLSGDTNEFVMGRNDKALELAVKSLLGTFAMLALLMKPEEEDKTQGWDFYGSGPLDPKENKIWREAGGKPYTFRFGKYYIPYQYSPLAIPVAASALWRELSKREGESRKQRGSLEKFARIVMTPFAAGTAAMMDQSFLTGVSDLQEAISSNDPTGEFLKITKNIGSRMIVPGFIRDANGLITNKKYETDNIAAGLLMEFPVLNKALGVEALNMFGDPIESKPLQVGPLPIPARLSGRLISEQNNSLAMQVLLKNSLEVSDWKKTARWGERDMSYEETRAYIKSAGPELKQFLEQNAEDITEMPQEEAQKLLDDVLTQIRAKAKADVADEFSLDFQGNSR